MSNAKMIALVELWLADESGYDETVWPRLKALMEEAKASTKGADEMSAAYAKLAALQQENELMRDVLKELEFLEYKGFHEIAPRCPICAVGKGVPHYGDCRLAKALATKEKPNAPTST